MIPWLKGLLYDPNSFANFVRVGVFILGEVLTEAVPASSAWWLGRVIQASALAIKAGDKNVPPTPARP